MCFAPGNLCMAIIVFTTVQFDQFLVFVAFRTVSVDFDLCFPLNKLKETNIPFSPVQVEKNKAQI